MRAIDHDHSNERTHLKRPITVGLCLAFAASALPQQLTLEDALRTAKENRPAVKAAQFRLHDAKRSGSALGSYPSTVLELGGTSPSAAGGDDDLVLTQPFDLFGRTSTLRRLARAQVRSAEFTYQSTLLDIQTEIILAFAEASTASRRAASARQILDTARQLHQTVQRKVDEGQAPAVQLQRSQIELSRVEQDVAIAVADLVSALERLAVVIGASERPELVQAELALPAVSDTSKYLHPLLASLRSDAEAAKAESSFLAKGSLPELELQGRRSGWGEESALYGARLQLTWPLFDHGKARSESSAASARAKAIDQDLLDASNVLAAELRAIAAQLTAAKQQVTAQRSINASVRDLVEKTRRAYTEGVGTFADLLEAIRTLRESELELAEAELFLNTTIARQYQAAGFLMEVWK
jgi:outer membrane protein TolC